MSENKVKSFKRRSPWAPLYVLIQRAIVTLAIAFVVSIGWNSQDHAVTQLVKIIFPSLLLGVYIAGAAKKIALKYYDRLNSPLLVYSGHVLYLTISIFLSTWMYKHFLDPGKTQPITSKVTLIAVSTVVMYCFILTILLMVPRILTLMRSKPVRKFGRWVLMGIGCL